MSDCLQSHIKKKIITDYNTYKNDTKHNHGFSLRPLIQNESDPRWGMEWTAKIFCTDDIFVGSKFVLKISLPPSFPAAAPKLQFMAPYPFHPNVTQTSGGLCYTLLTSDWQKNSNMTIPAFANIAGFLARPDFPSGYNQAPKELFNKNPSAYLVEVKRLSKIKT